MSGIRKWLCLFFGVALAAFALPGVAQNTKTFTISVSPASPPGVPVGKSLMTATFTSTSNGTPNSFELDATTPGNLTFDTSYTPKIIAGGITGQLATFNSTAIQFINTSPIKQNKPVTIQF